MKIKTKIKSTVRQKTKSDETVVKKVITPPIGGDTSYTGTYVSQGIY